MYHQTLSNVKLVAVVGVDDETGRIKEMLKALFGLYVGVLLRDDYEDGWIELPEFRQSVLSLVGAM